MSHVLPSHRDVSWYTLFILSSFLGADWPTSSYFPWSCRVSWLLACILLRLLNVDRHALSNKFHKCQYSRTGHSEKPGAILLSCGSSWVMPPKPQSLIKIISTWQAVLPRSFVAMICHLNLLYSWECFQPEKYLFTGINRKWQAVLQRTVFWLVGSNRLGEEAMVFYITNYLSSEMGCHLVYDHSNPQNVCLRCRDMTYPRGAAFEENSKSKIPPPFSGH